MVRGRTEQSALLPFHLRAEKRRAGVSRPVNTAGRSPYFYGYNILSNYIKYDSVIADYNVFLL